MVRSWSDVPDTVDDWSARALPVAQALRQAAGARFTTVPVFYYWSPAQNKVAADVPASATAVDRLVVADVLSASPVPVCSRPPRRFVPGEWVKVAYSPFVRQVGERLNFFDNPDMIFNAPSPLAASLTSAVIGAGLGYGLGWLGENILPQDPARRGRLRKTMTLVGAGLGSMAGVPWALANVMTGRSLNDPSLLQEPAGNERTDLRKFYPPPNEDLIRNMSPRAVERELAVLLHKDSADKQASLTWATQLPSAPSRPTPFDVNVDAMGRTLWQAGASPNLATATMGVLNAARTMPDPQAPQGFVTGHQFGQLAANAGKDYITGVLVGAVLNQATGIPITPTQAGAGNVVLGLIRSTLPKLFG